MNAGTIQVLIDAAKPFIRITGVKACDWRRNVQQGSRIGPWRYEAEYKVLDDRTWSKTGEVLYFVTNSENRLRLIGQSGLRLKDRWRTSPMHDRVTGASLGRRALFHSTAWKAIEAGFDEEAPPFTVSALFGDELRRILDANPGSFLVADGPHHLCRRVEASLLASSGSSMRLWNKHGIKAV